ncbi:hypothetical protein [Desulfobulbus alkaliphilus]|uniref:hypothetical protein n=1 Tax=Desulfobulbus alkaliphilus TaxID=869814 RepID=UPI001966460D|nr:hypothetical protein [Desulfobulbus alkaliphilus]MBM9535677.1 hypothetical protein [Desulfobulbus alkaliphilus]
MRNVLIVIVATVLGAGFGYAQDLKTHVEFYPATGNLVRFVYPATWSALSTAGGMGETNGPNGEYVFMGITGQFMTPEAMEAMVTQQKRILIQSGMPPRQVDMLIRNLRQSVGPTGSQPFHSPEEVITRLFPLFASLQNKQVTNTRIDQSETHAGLHGPMPGALHLVSYTLNGVVHRGLYYVATQWITPGQTWMFYSSGCSAPMEGFDATLPMMLTIWKSYLEDTVRSDWAEESVREGLNAAERWALEWGKVLRGYDAVGDVDNRE